MRERVYLDWNATTPLRPEARAAMIAAMDVVGNPSSAHAEGRAAKALMETSRAKIAAALGAEGADIVFTSGATEAIIGRLPRSRSPPGAPAGTRGSADRVPWGLLPRSAALTAAGKNHGEPDATDTGSLMSPFRRALGVS